MRHLFVCVCKVLSAHAHTLTQKHSHIGQQAKGQTFVSQLQNGSAFCSHPPISQRSPFHSYPPLIS